MTKNCCAALATLLARLSDLQAGYREAAGRVSDPMMVALLSHLFTTHLAHLATLIEARQGRGIDGPVADCAVPYWGPADLLATEADETGLFGLLDAEARMVAEYGRVLATVSTEDEPLRALLLTQRGAVQSRLDVLRGLLPRPEPALYFNPLVRRSPGLRADLQEPSP
jgi:hypothetical protein